LWQIHFFWQYAIEILRCVTGLRENECQEVSARFLVQLFLLRKKSSISLAAQERAALGLNVVIQPT
jgi:hypothetical protein